MCRMVQSSAVGDDDDDERFKDDVSIQSLQGKTFYLASSSNGMLIHVVIPIKDGDVTFDVLIDETTKLQSLFDEIQKMSNNVIPSDLMVGYVKDVSSECYPDECISWFCPKNGTLLIRPKLRGGDRSLVQKSFMKKADAVKALKKKMQTIYETDDDNNIPENKLPASFNTFIQEQEMALNEFLDDEDPCRSVVLCVGSQAPANGGGDDLEEHLEATEDIRWQEPD